MGLSSRQVREARAVAAVLPFRLNPYVVEELIDWTDIPSDPIFRLTFPQREMLAPRDFDAMVELIGDEAAPAVVEAAAARIRARLNPHPAGQRELNVPHFEGTPLAGVQHKYADTLLVFPAEGQTCHAYCGYCFRWAQFVGPREGRFASNDPARTAAYVRAHPEITDVLLTGGDPLVARAAVLRRHLEPLLAHDLERVNIRIGTKAPVYWPHRFLGDRDAEDLLRLFEEVIARGRHLTLVLHASHPRELGTEAAQKALARILATGAVVRCQAPVVRHVNDSAETWAELWSRQVRLGAIPYYMFVERDTGPRRYYELSISRALEIFERARSQVSGLAQTARGPVMSTVPGKVLVDGTVRVKGERAFVLKLIRARERERAGEVFLARHDERATWLDELCSFEGDWSGELDRDEDQAATRPLAVA